MSIHHVIYGKSSCSIGTWKTFLGFRRFTELLCQLFFRLKLLVVGAGAVDCWMSHGSIQENEMKEIRIIHFKKVRPLQS